MSTKVRRELRFWLWIVMSASLGVVIRGEERAATRQWLGAYANGAGVAVAFWMRSESERKERELTAASGEVSK